MEYISGIIQHSRSMDANDQESTNNRIAINSGLLKKITRKNSEDRVAPIIAVEDQPITAKHHALKVKCKHALDHDHAVKES